MVTRMLPSLRSANIDLKSQTGAVRPRSDPAIPVPSEDFYRSGGLFGSFGLERTA